MKRPSADAAQPNMLSKKIARKGPGQMIMSFGPGNAFLGWVPKKSEHACAEDREQAVDAQAVQKNPPEEDAGDAAIDVWQKAAESVERDYPDLSLEDTWAKVVEAVEFGEEVAKKTTEDNQRSSSAAAATSRN